MAKNWKAIAAVLSPDIPAGDLDRVIVPLGGLEAQFRPQVARLPLETEPAYVLMIPPTLKGPGAGRQASGQGAGTAARPQKDKV